MIDKNIFFYHPYYRIKFLISISRILQFRHSFLRNFTSFYRFLRYKKRVTVQPGGFCNLDYFQGMSIPGASSRLPAEIAQYRALDGMSIPGASSRLPAHPSIHPLSTYILAPPRAGKQKIGACFRPQIIIPTGRHRLFHKFALSGAYAIRLFRSFLSWRVYDIKSRHSRPVLSE